MDPQPSPSTAAATSAEAVPSTSGQPPLSLKHRDRRRYPAVAGLSRGCDRKVASLNRQRHCNTKRLSRNLVEIIVRAMPEAADPWQSPESWEVDVVDAAEATGHRSPEVRDVFHILEALLMAVKVRKWASMTRAIETIILLRWPRRPTVS